MYSVQNNFNGLISSPAKPRSSNVAVVTGSNKGIGMSIVKHLLMNQKDWVVYLTSRDTERGTDAVQCIQQELGVGAEYHPMDIEDVDSIRSFKTYINKVHPRGVDVLILNAGIFPKVITIETDDDEPVRFDKEHVRQTLKVNFFATLNVCIELFPLLTHEARVVFMSSRYSHLAFMNSPPTRQEQIKKCFTVEDVTKLMKDFYNTPPSSYEARGWLIKSPNAKLLPDLKLADVYPFGMSKLGVALLARAYQNDFRKRNYRIQFNACCPGKVHTDQNEMADLPPDQGADTPCFLADLSRECPYHGDFVAERKSIGHFVLSQDDLKFFLNMT